MCKSERRSADRLNLAAHHEAGHAVALVAQGLTVERVSIVRHGGIDGVCKHPALSKYITYSFAAHLDIERRHIAVYWAGIVTEFLLEGKRFSQDHVKGIIQWALADPPGERSGDFWEAISMAAFSSGVRWDLNAPLPPEIEQPVIHGAAEAERLVDREWQAVEALAKELQVRRWLRGKVVHSIVTPLLVEAMPALERVAF